MADRRHIVAIADRARHDTHWFNLRGDILPNLTLTAATVYRARSDALEMSEALDTGLFFLVVLVGYWLLLNGVEYVWNLTQAGNRLEMERLQRLLESPPSVLPSAGVTLPQMVEYVQAERERWGRAAPANAWGFISEISLSEDTTADFILDNANYKSYLFELENVVPTRDGVEFWLRTSKDGAASFDASPHYEWSSQTWTSQGFGSQDSDQADSKFLLAPNNSSAAHGYGVSGTIRVIGPANTAYTTVTARLIRPVQALCMCRPNLVVVT